MSKMSSPYTFLINIRYPTFKDYKNWQRKKKEEREETMEEKMKKMEKLFIDFKHLTPGIKTLIISNTGN